jgi:tRNA(adenine34) deaminase
MNLSYFDLAFDEAKKSFDLDEVPIGAVIVKDGKVIASTHNLKEKNQCCTSHAEILAIEEASKYFHNWRLDRCELYVTLDPCPMCASAIKQSRISHVYSALHNSDSNNLNIIQSIFQNNDSTNPSVLFESDLNSSKSQELLNKFFEKQRNR